MGSGSYLFGCDGLFWPSWFVCWVFIGVVLFVGAVWCLSVVASVGGSLVV